MLGAGIPHVFCILWSVVQRILKLCRTRAEIVVVSVRVTRPRTACCGSASALSASCEGCGPSGRNASRSPLCLRFLEVGRGLRNPRSGLASCEIWPASRWQSVCPSTAVSRPWRAVHALTHVRCREYPYTSERAPAESRTDAAKSSRAGVGRRDFEARSSSRAGVSGGRVEIFGCASRSGRAMPVAPREPEPMHATCRRDRSRRPVLVRPPGCRVWVRSSVVGAVLAGDALA